ncbi:hypothetical protein [Roseomonas sp. USHLN139]|uniref:hypothetical protein n=1 Tax=Roseomonas sp. USHLN139 TaxID=3081298 RepID=UPI003B014A55
MADGALTGAAAAAAGRQLGDWLAARWGGQLKDAFENGKGLTGPLARALLDTVVVDQVVGALWPSFALLAALLLLHGGTVALGLPEVERICTGLVVFAALAWTAYGLVAAARLAWPQLRFWLVTRLPPVAQTRLLLFQLIRAQHRELRDELPREGFGAQVLQETLLVLERRLGLTPDRAAYALADHLAPILLGHLLGRIFLLAAPVAGALLYYRLAIYPGLLAFTGAGPWSIAVYPFAALVDAVADTGLRTLLLRPSPVP